MTAPLMATAGSDLHLVTDTDDDPPISVLARGVSVLYCFDSDDRRELTLADITKSCRLPKATVHRLLRELIVLGLVERTDLGYRLGIKLFELGLRVPRQISIREVAFPCVQDLYEATQETVHLAIPDGHEALYLAKFSPRHTAPVPTAVGGRMPLYCTAVGKALLAHADRDLQRAILAGPMRRLTPRTVNAPGLLARQLDAVLSSGLAQDREEYARGVLCVAAPVFDTHGAAVAAISVSGWATQFDPARVGLAVRTAALSMTRALASLEEERAPSRGGRPPTTSHQRT